jgi:hypothetical protein
MKSNCKRPRFIMDCSARRRRRRSIKRRRRRKKKEVDGDE